MEGSISSLIKSIEIEYEGRKYICKIEIIDEELININIYLDTELKYKGNIFLEKIQMQIKAFLDYNINEVYEEIKQLDNNNFKIIKENNKYKLEIKFIILRRKKYLYISLNNNNNAYNNDYFENIIKEKDNTIFQLKEKIKLLEEKIINLTNNINYKKDDYNNNYNLNNNLNDFNISLKNPLHILNNHTNYIYCLTILNDGRLVSGSADSSIIIYDKTTYNPELIIKEHKNGVLYITQLSSGILASCSSDKTIKLFNLKRYNYDILQTLNYHTNSVYKIIELKNKYLASCSEDKSIIFYLKDKDKYLKDYHISTNGPCNCIIQIKENEICFAERFNNDGNNNKIHFFDINQRKIKSLISNISKSWLSPFIMISKELLCIFGDNKISIINVNEYKLIKIINVPNSSWIQGACILNENILLTGDNKLAIREWKIEGDNLILLSKKEKAHNNNISTLLNIGNGYIASGSDDKSIKIW